VPPALQEELRIGMQRPDLSPQPGRG
jgi:hypothetical protein